MKLKIGKQYRRILVVLIIIWIVQDSYHYHHKYEPIDLTSKESIIQSLKSDKELLHETKMIMLEEIEKTEKKTVTIESRGLKGYRRYHSEVLREVFQKYRLSYIWINRIDATQRIEIEFSIPKVLRKDKVAYRGLHFNITYHGFYYKEDGEPSLSEGGGELKESGNGYVQETWSHIYYTEPIGDGWYYYETTYYNGLIF